MPTFESDGPTPGYQAGGGTEVSGGVAAAGAPARQTAGSGSGAGASAGRAGRGGQEQSGARRLFDVAVIVVVALAAALLVRTFVLQSFYIPSRSMEPTLQIGDRIIVNKLSYHLHGVGRGDVVVFARPPGEAAVCSPPPVNDLVKRVIGLPGETISVAGGQVYIDGRLLPEPWLPAGTITQAGPGSAPFSLSHPFHIPQGYYFVMGDNRTESCDSRYWGPIPRSLIVGKVDLRIWPLNRIAWF